MACCAQARASHDCQCAAATHCETLITAALVAACRHLKASTSCSPFSLSASATTCQVCVQLAAYKCNRQALAVPLSDLGATCQPCTVACSWLLCLPMQLLVSIRGLHALMQPMSSAELPPLHPQAWPAGGRSLESDAPGLSGGDGRQRGRDSVPLQQGQTASHLLGKNAQLLMTRQACLL